ncbi:polysaccharide biosynthesis/export family protein [Dyadobacter crusticola]|uniref:polysaccharide biosynthesis/export family protein n=1 Tax=Dyadobacter crusticola TaxID=292407 RepID=UPI0004E176C0|nr:polysaccharide biosynthesis/export family protein [Dyadobacter crusticola]
MVNLYSLSLRSFLCLFAAGLVAACNVSCITPKQMVYFQNSSPENTVDSIMQDYIPTIQKNDMLSITVGSLNLEANDIFNTVSQRAPSVAVNGGQATSQPYGHLVFADGSIEMPLIGKVHVEGLELQQAADTLRRKLNKYLKAPSVAIHILNFKVSVLGEVNKPAVYTITDGKVTLPEALGLAGDLTIYGRRDNILVVREEKGKRAYTRVDLTSKAIFDSPYYYLHKDDLVYVEPAKARMTHADRAYQILPLSLSIITTVSLVLFRVL